MADRLVNDRKDPLILSLIAYYITRSREVEEALITIPGIDSNRKKFDLHQITGHTERAVKAKVIDVTI
jgi:hypothetical protein